MFDAYKLMAEDFLHKGINELPYRGEDVETAIAMWSSVNYRENLNLFNQEGFKIDTTFFNSSHILGSAFVQINCDGKKALFTGDMGNDSLLLEEADIPDNSDYVFMETVYGNRVHEHIENRKENLRQVILDVIHKKGTLVIPAFAIERTQEVLSEINDFVEERKMPVIPVYLDSPLSIAITKIFYHYKNLLNKESREKMGRGDDIFNFPGLHFSHNRYDSIEINKIHGPKIVIAGSGMVAGGRVIHHIRQYIEHKQNTILFVGYQSHGTAGRRLQQGEKHMNFFGADINVEAEIKTVSGYSAHRDMNSLLKFVQAVKKKAVQIFLILGDKESTQGFQKFVKEKENLDVEICKEKIEYILG
jgi:metallo-beta-lactamase family protein